MPRPKGSKNRKTLIAAENVEEKITALQSEIAKLTTELRAKKAELKRLVKVRLEAEKAAAARKSEEDKKRLLEAVKRSGKSIEEILDLLE